MFVLKTAMRYAFSKSKGQRTSSIVIIIGLALGLMALLVISSIMNGLQTAQLDQLRAIESFDLIVENIDPSELDEIKNIEGVDKAFNFIQTSALLVDKTSGKSTTTRVRAYSDDAFSNKRMSNDLRIYAGDTSGIMVSYNLLRNLSMNILDNINITYLKPGRTATIVPYTASLSISGYYASSMTEFSSNTVFVDYDYLLNLMGTSSVKIAIYANTKASFIKTQILKIYPEAKVTTWQEYNKALYSALMLEKALMYIFLAFMFLIICVNLKNTTKRLLKNKQQEGAMLRAIGATRKTVNSIFLIQGLSICLIGEIVGVALGFLVICNLQQVLNFAETIARMFTGSSTILGILQFQAIVSPAEVVSSCVFVFILALIFCLAGCHRIYKREIMEVILDASN